MLFVLVSLTIWVIGVPVMLLCLAVTTIGLAALRAPRWKADWSLDASLQVNRSREVDNDP